MNGSLGRVILGLSGSGFPLTQAVIRRFGRCGAVVVAGVTGGLLVRDVAMIADGVPKRLAPGPARLLYLEAAAAGAATAAGIALLRDPGVAAARTDGWRVPRQELVRRFAVGALFGLHTMRFRIYLSPGSGRREPAEAAALVPPSSERRLSRKERVGLVLHRGLDKRLSRLGVWVMRRTRGGITRPWKVDALLLTTCGRRSGRDRTVVLQYFPDGEAMILAAANDGGAAHPGWYFNLVAEPAARVEVMGRSIDVRAEELATDEVDAWWERILRRDRNYERYARATSRTIPLIRLVPVPAGG